MTEVVIRCPNGHYELDIDGKSREFIEAIVLQAPDERKPCPQCGAAAEREWSE